MADVCSFPEHSQAPLTLASSALSSSSSARVNPSGAAPRAALSTGTSVMASASRPLLGELRLISVADKEQRALNKQAAGEARYAKQGEGEAELREGAAPGRGTETPAALSSTSTDRNRQQHRAFRSLTAPVPGTVGGDGPGGGSGAKERPPEPLPHRRGRVPPHGSGVSRPAVPGTPRHQAAQARCAAPGPYPGSRSPWRCPGPVQPPPPPPPVTRSARAARPFRGGSRAQRVTAASPR